MTKRAALYLRVSTTRQAKKDLSIPDQRLQAEAYCKAKGWSVITDYVEPGASATDDKRPKLQEMIADAARPDNPFDVVIVHSFSRFFRDAYQFEFYRRKLAKHGVEIASISQELGDDPMADMVRQILTVFDEYQSKENSKHVRRTMKENARQGYWNGGPPPYGYRTAAAGMRGDTVKKKLEIEPPEAVIVRQVFDYSLQGKGLRTIASTLNDNGLRYRNSRLFNSCLIHQILTRTTYTGHHYFNKTDSKTRKQRARSEWVEMASPVIISQETFDKAEAMRKQRQPSKTPPRVVNGPTLLTGVAKCATCGGGMTLRTGKGGRYRYYTCNKRSTEGACSCKGRSIPMKRLDDLVIGQFKKSILSPERIETLLGKLIERQQSQNNNNDGEAHHLKKELRETQKKIDRLYDAVAEGALENSTDLQSAVSRQKQRKDELIRQISSLGRKRDIPKNILSVKNIEAFASVIQKQLSNPDGKFRKNYLRLFVDRVEVDDEEIRIFGPKSALVQGLMETKKPDTLGVPSFDTEWWTNPDRQNVPRVLHAIGCFPIDLISDAAQSVYDTGGYDSGLGIRVRLVAVGRDKSEALKEEYPIIIQLSWGDILSFIWDRFSKYQNQKRDIHQWDDIGKELKGLVDRHIKDEFVQSCLNGMGVRT